VATATPAFPKASRRDEERLHALDAVRGVAALLVVIAHCHSALPELLQQELGLREGWARLLVLGRPAVILFFVLSGLVLSLSMAGNPRRSYRHFVIQRIFRIYVPFAVSILMAAAAYQLIQPAPVPALSTWFNTFVWSQPPTPALVLGHLAMTGHPAEVSLNNAMWSLVVEMRLSLVFPILFALLWTRRGLAGPIAVALTLLGIMIPRITGLEVEPYFNTTDWEAVLLSVYFLPFFLIGMVIAQRRAQVIGLLRQIGTGGRAAAWLLALMLMSLEQDALNGAGAALVLLLALASPGMARLLSQPAPQWLGRISYSLYLSHLLVLGALLHLFHGVVPLPWLLAAVVPVSLLVAHLGHAWVEVPSLAAGRWLTRPRLPA
jgi:peptidoglycan/LPS O-acetylase OafA/YrhL